jgi:hypothetical protein
MALLPNRQIQFSMTEPRMRANLARSAPALPLVDPGDAARQPALPTSVTVASPC